MALFDKQTTAVIADTFRAMDGIDAAVQSAFSPEDEVALQRLGERIAEQLKSWPEYGEHNPGWVAKKAHDSMRSRLWELVHATMNLDLGLPADHLG